MKTIKDKFLSKILTEEAYNRAFQFKWKRHNPGYPQKTLHKISICTNCMGRAENIKETYEQNIKDCSYYPNIEFVLLNYNSQDDLSEYVKKYLSKYIRLGFLNYYEMIGPELRGYPLPQY